MKYVGDSFQLVFPSNPTIINQYQANNSIPLPESTQCANITILDNTVVEQDSVKTFTVSLSSENTSVTITGQDTSAVEVVDNDCTSVFMCLDVHLYTYLHAHSHSHSCHGWLEFNGTCGLGGCTISEHLCSADRRG